MSLNCLTIAHRNIESLIFSNQLFKAVGMQEQAKSHTFSLETQHYSNENGDYEIWQADQGLRVDGVIENSQASGKNIDCAWVVLLEANYGQPAEGVFCQVLFETLQAKFPEAIFVLTSTTETSLELGLQLLCPQADRPNWLFMNPIKTTNEEEVTPTILTRSKTILRLKSLLLSTKNDRSLGGAIEAQVSDKLSPDLKDVVLISAAMQSIELTKDSQDSIPQSFSQEAKVDSKGRCLTLHGGVSTAPTASSDTAAKAVQLALQQNLLLQYTALENGKNPETVKLTGESPNRDAVAKNPPAYPSCQRP